MVRPVYDETVGAKLLYGHDGTDPQAINTDPSGNLRVKVDNFPEVISGVSVPVNDADVKSILQSILTKITGLVFVVELGSFIATIGD